jgi:CheY-like chemotaxis protein/DNA-directed RNA polymerase subunit RPC12/RpoP
MNCPRCKTAITQSFDPDSIILCPGCGSRLMTRAAALRSQGKMKAPEDSPAEQSEPGAPPPDPASSGEPVSPAVAEFPPSATIPPSAGMEASPAPAAAAGAPSLELVLHELQIIRVTQVQILEALRRGAGGESVAAALEDPGPDATQVLAPVRSRRRKTVLLVDDDPASQKGAVDELQQADVPVRAVADGNAALAAIAEEKPDVVALELGLGGEMAGKDLINMIKATMEWVDIPIVLWTREAVNSQKEARLQHGADEVVHKGSGPAALVTRVITLFRRA